MRFLADMGVDVRVVAWLNAQGREAIHQDSPLPDWCFIEVRMQKSDIRNQKSGADKSRG